MATLFGVSNLLSFNFDLPQEVSTQDIVDAPVIDNPQTGSGEPSNKLPSLSKEIGQWFSSNWYYVVIAILVLILIIVLVRKNKKDANK